MILKCIWNQMLIKIISKNISHAKALDWNERRQVVSLMIRIFAAQAKNIFL